MTIAETAPGMPRCHRMSNFGQPENVMIYVYNLDFSDIEDTGKVKEDKGGYEHGRSKSKVFISFLEKHCLYN